VVRNGAVQWVHLDSVSTKRSAMLGRASVPLLVAGGINEAHV